MWRHLFLWRDVWLILLAKCCRMLFLNYVSFPLYYFWLDMQQHPAVVSWKYIATFIRIISGFLLIFLLNSLRNGHRGKECPCYFCQVFSISCPCSSSSSFLCITTRARKSEQKSTEQEKKKTKVLAVYGGWKEEIEGRKSRSVSRSSRLFC